VELGDQKENTCRSIHSTTSSLLFSEVEAAYLNSIESGPALRHL